MAIDDKMANAINKAPINPILAPKPQPKDSEVFDLSIANCWDWPLQHNDGFVDVTNNEQKFEVGLETQLFKPNEIEVRVCSNELVIHCRHEPRPEDVRSKSREVHRAYRLPCDVDTTTLKSHLNKGVLIISAKKKPQAS